MDPTELFTEVLTLKDWAELVLSWFVPPHFLLGSDAEITEEEEEEEHEKEKVKNEKEKVKNEKKEQEKNEKKEQEKKEKKETPKSTRELRPKRNVAQYSPGVCAEVAAILDSTSLRKLIPKERAVLARFCAAHQIPVLSRDEVSCYMGDAPQKVMETDVKNRFVSEQHELSYPRTLKAFHGLLLEAKELQELAEAQGARRLVGVCLLMPCLVTNVATREASEGPLQDEDAGQDAEQYAEQDVEHEAEQDVEHDAEHYLVQYARDDAGQYVEQDAEHYLVRYAGHDAEQYDAEQYDAEQYDSEQYDAEQYDSEQYDSEQYDAEQYVVHYAGHDVEQYDAEQYAEQYLVQDAEQDEVQDAEQYLVQDAEQDAQAPAGKRKP